MIKYFCDTCKEEINIDSDGSRYVYFDFKKEKGGMVPIQREIILCPKCTEKVKNLLNSMKPPKFVSTVGED